MRTTMPWFLLGTILLCLGTTAVADDSSPDAGASFSSSSASSSSSLAGTYAHCTPLKGIEKMECLRDRKNSRILNRILQRTTRSSASSAEKDYGLRNTLANCTRIRHDSGRGACFQRALRGTQQAVEGFRSVRYQCHDDTRGIGGGNGMCATAETWETFAATICTGHCSYATGICGVNAITFGESCSSR